jgi:RHS repeat-associated protein
LLIDGGSSELLFNPPATPGGTYGSPNGDFSTLERLADGTFRRTMKDQTVYQFNAQNKLVSIADREGNTTQYVYAGGTQLTQIIDPVGLTTTLTYTGDRVTAIIDPTGRTTQLSYDAAGNLTQITDPDGSSRQWEYDPNHLLTATTDQEGNRGVDIYDFSGRIIEAIRKDGSVIQIAPVEIQGLYRPEATIDPLAAPAAFAALTTAQASYADAKGNVTQAQLDQLGQTISSTDGVGVLPFDSRNALNLVSATTDSNGHVVSYTYDAQGNATSRQETLLTGLTATDTLFPNPTYPTGYEVQTSVSGDLNLDGRPDIVTLNIGSSNVSVLLGEGDGTLQSKTDYSLGGAFPTAIALGDLNSDGTLDLLVAAATSGGGYGSPTQYDLLILPGQANGQFGTATRINLGVEALAIALSDLNRDGKLDIVTANLGSNPPDFLVAGRTPTSAAANFNNSTVSVLLGQGNGTFSPRQDYETGDNSRAVVIGDVNQDGQLDIVAANEGDDTVSVLFGNGSGSFAPKTDYEVSTSPTSVSLGDLNQDGKLDLVTGNTRANTVSVLLANNNGGFAPKTDYEVGNDPKPVALGDLNRDGLLDIVVGSIGTNTVSVLLGQGAGSFAAKVDYQVQNAASAVILTDLNADGNLDVAATTGDSVSVLLGNPNGSLTGAAQPVTQYSVGALNAITIGDLNGDRYLDAVVGNSSIAGVSVMLGQADGKFFLNSNLSLNSIVTAVALGDLNGDSRLDMIATSSNSSFSVFLGRGNGNFAAPVAYAVGFNPRSVSLGDFNRDGNLDVVTANVDSNNVSVLLGNSNGTFAARVDYQTGAAPESVFLGDINKDGRLDIVTANRNGNSVSLLLGNDNGSFRAGGNYAVGNNPVAVALGDINRDGNVDLVTAGSKVSVLLGSGNGTFGSAVSYGSDIQASAMQLVDINEDAALDVVVTVPNRGGVGVLLGQGNGGFGNLTLYSLGSAPAAIAVGDLQQDADLDLISAGSGGMSVLFNRIFSIRQETVRRTYTYDLVFDQRTSVTDELGHQTLYSLDPSTGNVLSTTQVVGELGGGDDRVTSFTYLAQGLVDTVTDALGRVTDYDYDALGRLVAETFAKGTVDQATRQYKYDAAGNLVTLIDENGHLTAYQYDAMNRLVQITQADPDGAGVLASPITTFTYDAMGQLQTVTDARGNVTRYDYDAMGQLVQVTEADPDGAGVLTSPITQYAYDAVGNLIGVTDPRGNVTQYQYDSRDLQIATIDAAGGKTEYGYDPNDNLTTTIDPLAQISNYFYDARSRLIRAVDPVGANTIFSYDATDNLVAAYDPNKRPTRYTYDALDQLIQTTDALGETATLIYDAVGNIASSTDELGRVTTYTYDNRNRLKTVTDPLNRTTTYGYDAASNLITVTDPLNHTTTFSYDALNRQVGITDALGNTTLTAYDANGNIIAIADPVGNVTTYAYDALNRQIAETNELGYSRSYSYDAYGNLVQTTDRDGRVRTFTYDSLNRQTTEKWLDSSGQTLNLFSYSYDANSQLKTAEDANSTYRYSYDAGGRLTSVDNTGTPGMPSVLLNYSYDLAGNRIKTTDTIKGSLRGITSYIYDALNRLTRITQSGSGVLNKRVDMTYDAASQLTGVSRYSDLTGTQLVASSAYTYDAAGQLIDLQHRNKTSVLADYGYGYDADGRLIETTSPDGNSSYSYDEIDQLTGASYSYQTNEGYSYDENGNRTNAGYQTGVNNQLLSDGVYNYSYDKEGNRTKRTNIATGEVTDYSWDYRNRLTQVTVKNATGTVVEQVQYSYDLYDRRLTQTVDPDGAGTAPTTTERYVYDGDNLALVFDGQGNLKERYLFGAQVDQVLAAETQGKVLWVLADSQGTVSDVVDNAGVVLNHLSYDSFGNITNETNPSIDVRFTYTGREFDAATGLYYYRSRYFDPLTGGFISEDTIGFAGEDVNLYRYVGNSPTNFIDPYGLFGAGVTGGVSGAAGFVGAQGSAGGGYFSEGGPQAFWSYGGTSSNGLKKFDPEDFATGLYLGGDLSVFVTNANSACDLKKTTNTASINIAIPGLRIKGIPVVISAQLSYGNGIYSANFPIGVGSGGFLEVSNYKTTTGVLGVDKKIGEEKSDCSC